MYTNFESGKFKFISKNKKKINNINNININIYNINFKRIKKI